MPREKGFLGFGDERTDKEAFEEGKQESRKAGSADDWAKLGPRAVEKFVENTSGGDPRTSKEKAYDAGWEKGKKERPYYERPKHEKREKKKKESYGGGGGGGYDGGGSSSGGDVLLSLGCLGIILLAVCGGIYFMYYQGEKIYQASRQMPKGDNRRTTRLPDGTEVINKDSNGYGGIKYVKTKELNVRSGPGENYPIVRKAYQGEKILIYGQPEQVGNSRWSVSIGVDQSTRGWVNLKYLSDNNVATSTDDKFVSPSKNEDTSITYPTDKSSSDLNSQNSRNVRSTNTAQTQTVPRSESRVSAVDVQKRDAAAKLFGLNPNSDGTYSGPDCGRCRLVKAKGNGYTMERVD